MDRSRGRPRPYDRGYKNRDAASASEQHAGNDDESTDSVLRIFDETKAREFYVAYLGFRVDWEHRFGDNFPVFLQISSGACVINLSEHHGDACPGAAVRIAVEGLADYHKTLHEKQYKYAKPGLEVRPYGVREMVIGDPFGNRLIFFDRDV